MNTLSYTTAREQLAKTMERVCRNHDPILITRQKKESVVMLSLDDYEALEETAYLIRSPRNAKRLLESIEQLELGRGKKHKVAECP